MKIVLGAEDMKELPISVNPKIMGGSPVFRGTRVPTDALWNNLSDGMSLDEFVESFPTVERADAIHLLRFADRFLKALAYATANDKPAGE